MGQQKKKIDFLNCRKIQKKKKKTYGKQKKTVVELLSLP